MKFGHEILMKLIKMDKEADQYEHIQARKIWHGRTCSWITNFQTRKSKSSGIAVLASEDWPERVG